MSSQDLLSMLPKRRSERLLKEENVVRVDFSVYFDIYEIPALDDFSAREKKDCWFGRQELDKLRIGQQVTLKKINNGEKKASRGLESYTREGHKLLDEMIFESYQAVMGEQDRQWVKGRDDYDRIAKQARKASKRSSTYARQVAQNDMEEARKAYKSMGFKDEDLKSFDTNSVKRRSTKLDKFKRSASVPSNILSEVSKKKEFQRPNSEFKLKTSSSTTTTKDNITKKSDHLKRSSSEPKFQLEAEQLEPQEEQLKPTGFLKVVPSVQDKKRRTSCHNIAPAAA